MGETSFVRVGGHNTSYGKAVYDVEFHHIIDILLSRHFVFVSGFLDKQPAALKDRIDFGAWNLSATLGAVYAVIPPKAGLVVDLLNFIPLAN